MLAYSKEREIALQATIVASQFCEKVRRDQASQAFAKPDHSPVTVADYGAQALICQTLKAQFPQDAVVGEEDPLVLSSPGMQSCLDQVTAYVQTWVTGATSQDVLDWVGQGQDPTGQRFWTVDPIDGTKGYVRGDQYAIALALIEEGVVQVGVMACPALPVQFGGTGGPQSPGVVFTAVRGQGAEMLSLASGTRSPLAVNRISTPQGFQLIESVERDHGTPEWQHRVIQSLGWQLPPLRMDSLAKYGAIARGEADLYLRLPTGNSLQRRENIWDHAAGVIVLEEAGGKVTDQWGKPLNFACGTKLQDNEGIVASNGYIHEAVLEAIGERAEA